MQLCLCWRLPTAALADGLETGTPTLLNGEGETDYATPSEEDGWTQLGNGTWFLAANKTYDQPLRSENPIQIDRNATLTAPSITVDGKVDVSGSAYLICSGELSAKELKFLHRDRRLKIFTRRKNHAKLIAAAAARSP